MRSVILADDPMRWSHTRLWGIGLMLRVFFVYAMLFLALEAYLITIWPILVIALSVEAVMLVLAMRGQSGRSVGTFLLLGLCGFNGFHFALSGAAMILQSGAQLPHLASFALALVLTVILTLSFLRQVDIARIHRAQVRRGALRRAGAITTYDPSKADLVVWKVEDWSRWQRLAGFWLPLCGIPLMLLAGGARYGADVPVPFLYLAGQGFVLFSVCLFPLSVAPLLTWRLIRFEERAVA